MRRPSRLVPLSLLAFTLIAVAAPEGPKGDYNPPLAKASDEAEKAIPRFQRDPRLKIEVWAAEPMLAHPVAFAFDEKGRCYVAETFRHSRGTTDNRGHMHWLDDELALRTVAERVALYKKDAGARFSQVYEKERERVRLVEDTTGSGKADKSTVFRDDFGGAADGLGAGLLARKGNIYYTCIPDLWLLKDTKGTGTADVKQSLSTGYGVHTAFIGHDLHGLRIGPDGRLYFTVGDRGLNVTTKEGKHLFNPDSGAVLRCELDGSNLEIFATGLRNPQELAFDDYGNLFTVDNNSDSGDQARFVHIVQGGDSGWRIGYQYPTAMHDETVRQGNRGPWNYELLWKEGEKQAAYVVPPLKNFSNGPSGFTHYPGVGLSDKYKGHFFLANFSGGPGNSGVFAFTTKPKGATFELVGDHKFIWNILATDCDFGPDSALYVSDWVDGWNVNGKGRIYKVTDPEGMKNPAVAEAKALLAEGLEKKSPKELAQLLGHTHRDVRMEAQLELANRGKDGVKIFEDVATDIHRDQVARLHALWGYGMLARKRRIGEYDIGVGYTTDIFLQKCYADSNPLVRSAAISLLPDFKTKVPEELVSKETDPSVLMTACLALERQRDYSLENLDGDKPPFPLELVYRILRDNDDKDPMLRHAGIMALARRVPVPHLIKAGDDKSPAVRLAVVVALRRRKAPEVAAFLNDADPKVVAEAARAINDELITAALPKLAALITKPNLPRVVAYRVLNAHFLLGKDANAAALAAFAARTDVPDALRAVAVRMLGDWAKPPRRDYITGLTQSLAARPKEEAVAVLTHSRTLSAIAAAPEAVKTEFVAAAVDLEAAPAGQTLFAFATDAKAGSDLRIAALRGLEKLKDPRLSEAATVATKATSGRVRNAGRTLLFKNDPAKAVADLREALTGTDLAERQGAFAILAAYPSDPGNALLEEWLDAVIAKKAPPELWLDVLEAAEKVNSERIKRRLAGFNQNRPKGDEVANFRESLAGGDAAKGKEIFLNKTAVQCQRCHQLDGQGGEVGPPVNGAGKQPREYLLESIVLPSKAIAKGFEAILITTLDGKTVTGVLKAEDEKEVKVMTAEAKLVVVKKEDIDDRKATKSAMPEDIVGKLTKREIRDLVEFLSGLKADWKK
jgi:quinoprotein glucose dehydrogenase